MHWFHLQSPTLTSLKAVVSIVWRKCETVIFRGISIILGYHATITMSDSNILNSGLDSSAFILTESSLTMDNVEIQNIAKENDYSSIAGNSKYDNM